MNGWKPRVREGEGVLYEQLVEAMARDVAAGVLKPGARLPPHRDLADSLGLSIGTVSRAYAEAERRGLLSASVGRGSFIAGDRPSDPLAFHDAQPSAAIDLARNLPPSAPSVRRIAGALERVRRRPELEAIVTYTLPDGLEITRRAGADWLRRRHGLATADPDRLIQCNGGQQALALCLSALCAPGDAILCEEATFLGIKSCAQQSGYRLQPVRLDSGGIDPEDLARAARSSGARVLYTIPTLQNPTARTMSLARRRAIAKVARAEGLWLIEDDAYRGYAGANPPPTLAELVPERCFYVGSLSKALAPGLRLCFLQPPDALHRDLVLRAIRATGYAPPALGGLLFTQWWEDGVADEIADEILSEVQRRTSLAERMIGDVWQAPSSPHSLHVWLPMSDLDAERAAGRALRAGVEVTPPDAPLIAGAANTGLRLCLGAAASLERLEEALSIVRASLSAEVNEQARAVV